MKNIYWVFFIAMVITLIPVNAQTLNQQIQHQKKCQEVQKENHNLKKGLVILPFKEKGIFSEKDRDVGSVISDLILGKIDMAQYEIIDHVNIPEAVKASLFNEIQCISEADKLMLKGMKIDHILVGQISNISGRYYGSYRIIDIQSSIILKNKDGRYMKDSIMEGLPDFQSYVNALFDSLCKVKFIQIEIDEENKSIKSNNYSSTFIEKEQLEKFDGKWIGKLTCEQNNMMITISRNRARLNDQNETWPISIKDNILTFKNVATEVYYTIWTMKFIDQKKVKVMFSHSWINKNGEGIFERVEH